MGPRIREDNGRGRADPESPLQLVVVGELEGEGRFQTCPHGEGVVRRGRGKDGFPPPFSWRQALRGKNG